MMENGDILIEFVGGDAERKPDDKRENKNDNTSD